MMQNKYTKYQIAMGKTDILIGKQDNLSCDLVDEYFAFLETCPLLLQGLCFKRLQFTKNKAVYDAFKTYKHEDYSKISNNIRAFFLKDYLAFQLEHYPEYFKYPSTHPNLNEELMLAYYLFSED